MLDRRLLGIPAVFALCLVVSFVLTGCGGGGPAPTSVNLTNAGVQIIDDTTAVWDTFSGIGNMKLADLETKVGEEITPNLAYAEAGLSGNFGALATVFSLFHITPGEYTATELAAAIPDACLYKGIWTITAYGDGTMILVVNRAVDGLDDVVTYSMTSTADPDLDYHGEFVYPTKALVYAESGYGVELFVQPLSGSIEIYAANANLKSLTLSGTAYLDAPNLTVEVHGSFEADFEGMSNPYTNYLKFAGDLAFHHTPGTEDVLNGTLETADLILSGRTGLSWVANPDQLLPEIPIWFTQICPSKLTVEGSIRDKVADPTVVEGKLTMEILNAATFDPNLPYGPDNFAHFKGSLAVLLQAENGNKIKAAIGVEEAGFLADARQYIVTGTYDLTRGGEARRLTLLLRDDSAALLHVEIDSTWGPAKLVMDASFPGDIQDGGVPTDITGAVYVGGTQVGVVSLNTDQIEIHYNDSTYEIFPL